MAIVTQAWVGEIPLMQQTVLLTAIRGPDGVSKYNSCKMLLRWYRRCVLLSALDKKVLTDPYARNGGSFTGPSMSVDNEDAAKLHMPTFGAAYPEAHDQLDWRFTMDELVGHYLKDADAIPHHFQMHFLHAIEILGYKHPRRHIAEWWQRVYIRLVHSLHLHPETEAELDRRLGDTREGWLERADVATVD
ncbi:MAG: hypothetical protein E6R03_02970 [Hyphomicrobiaceae bacterium]|nr:MAG: hypothetical protein E6R03_02970 [Hyphomicrobiaceae bacterium]